MERGPAQPPCLGLGCASDDNCRTSTLPRCAKSDPCAVLVHNPYPVGLLGLCSLAVHSPLQLQWCNHASVSSLVPPPTRTEEKRIIRSRVTRRIILKHLRVPLPLCHVNFKSSNKYLQIFQQLKVPTDIYKSSNNITVPTEIYKSPNNKTVPTEIYKSPNKYLQIFQQ